MQQAMTMQAALRVLTGNGEVTETVVDRFIRRVNCFMSTRAQMEYHRHETGQGACYEFCVASPTATAEDCRQIVESFRSAGWLDVRLDYRQGVASMTLDAEKFRGWTSTYNGLPLTEEHCHQAH